MKQGLFVQLQPVVLEWSARAELELEVRLSTSQDEQDFVRFVCLSFFFLFVFAQTNVVSIFFFRNVNYLAKSPSFHIEERKRDELTRCVPMIDLNFSTTVDHFYDINDAGDQVRRTLLLDGHEIQRIRKTRCTTTNVVFHKLHEPLHTKRARQDEHVPTFPPAGLGVRFSSSFEDVIDAHTPLPNNGVVAYVRIKDRVSFLSKKGDFQIDCTRVRTGVDAKQADVSPSRYEVLFFVAPPFFSFSFFLFLCFCFSTIMASRWLQIEVEALRVPTNIEKARSNAHLFMIHFLYKSVAAMYVSLSWLSRHHGVFFVFVFVFVLNAVPLRDNGFRFAVVPEKLHCVVDRHCMGSKCATRTKERKEEKEETRNNGDDDDNDSHDDDDDDDCKGNDQNKTKKKEKKE